MNCFDGLFISGPQFSSMDYFQTLLSYGLTNGIKRWWFYNGNVNDDNRSDNHTILMSGANLAVDKFRNSLNLCNANFESRSFNFTPSPITILILSIFFRHALYMGYNGALFIFKANIDVPYDV